MDQQTRERVEQAQQRYLRAQDARRAGLAAPRERLLAAWAEEALAAERLILVLEEALHPLQRVVAFDPAEGGAVGIFETSAGYPRDKGSMTTHSITVDVRKDGMSVFSSPRHRRDSWVEEPHWLTNYDHNDNGTYTPKRYPGKHRGEGFDRPVRGHDAVLGEAFKNLHGYNPMDD